MTKQRQPAFSASHTSSSGAGASNVMKSRRRSFLGAHREHGRTAKGYPIVSTADPDSIGNYAIGVEVMARNPHIVRLA
jgi:hypothetical protein